MHMVTSSHHPQGCLIPLLSHRHIQNIGDCVSIEVVHLKLIEK